MLHFDSKDPLRVKKAHFSKDVNVANNDVEANNDGGALGKSVTSITSSLFADNGRKKISSLTGDEDICSQHVISPIEHTLHRCEGELHLDTKCLGDFQESVDDNSTDLYCNNDSRPKFNTQFKDRVATRKALLLANRSQSDGHDLTESSPDLNASEDNEITDTLDMYTYDETIDDPYDKRSSETGSGISSFDESDQEQPNLRYKTEFEKYENDDECNEIESLKSVRTDVSERSIQLVNDWLDKNSSDFSLGRTSCHKNLEDGFDGTGIKDQLISESSFDANGHLDSPLYNSLEIGTIFDGVMYNDSMEQVEYTQPSSEHSYSSNEAMAFLNRPFQNYDSTKSKSFSEVKMSQQRHNRCHDSNTKKAKRVPPKTLLELATDKDGITFARQTKITEDLDRLKYLEGQILLGTSPRRARRKAFRLEPLKDGASTLTNNKGNKIRHERHLSMSSVMSQTLPVILKDSKVQAQPSQNDAVTQAPSVEKIQIVEKLKPKRHPYEMRQRHRIDTLEIIQRAHKLSKYSCADNILSERAIGCEFNTRLDNRDYIATRPLPPIVPNVPPRKKRVSRHRMSSGRSSINSPYKSNAFNRKLTRWHF
ncbi:unnamed protein product [Owenia fusiformis]|uniref:Uncharacterized protein n=1 Tax=Owenia fusiformis TaxID=6347 RepID=A0A8J1TBL4_OWEFU|nr:unnamed protein product [Owenia fusiformis]